MPYQRQEDLDRLRGISEADVHQAATREYNSMMDRQTGGVGIWEPDLEAARQAKQRRDRIAEGFAFALASNDITPDEILVSYAITLTDRLIAELDRT